MPSASKGLRVSEPDPQYGRKGQGLLGPEPQYGRKGQGSGAIPWSVSPTCRRSPRHFVRLASRARANRAAVRTIWFHGRSVWTTLDLARSASSWLVVASSLADRRDE